jgi:glutathione S-transferase
LTWLAVPVPADPADRHELVAATGSDFIPAAVLGDGTVLADSDEIVAELGRRFPEPEGAEGHRRKAVAHGFTRSA